MMTVTIEREPGISPTGDGSGDMCVSAILKHDGDKIGRSSITVSHDDVVNLPGPQAPVVNMTVWISQHYQEDFPSQNDSELVDQLKMLWALEGFKVNTSLVAVM